jgi:D-glycerate 3-kinase
MRLYSPIQKTHLKSLTPSVFHPFLEHVDSELWNSLGQKLWQKFGTEQEAESRIHGYYLPLVFYLSDQLKVSSEERRPLIVGVNGPQGAGKSTLTHELSFLLSELGFQAVSLSIDDFYLNRNQQIELALQFPDNPFLQQRGYPGTHDIELGRQTLQKLKTNLKEGEIFIPVYDKSKYQGQGDRLPESEWKKVTSPVDLIFLEGWMLGFIPVPEVNLPHSNLKQINHFLMEYQQWYDFIDRFIFLNPKDYRDVLDWRVEAEEKMKATGRPGMSRSQIEAYIDKFLPAYEIYLPQLRRKFEIEASKPEWIQLNLLTNRLPEI